MTTSGWNKTRALSLVLVAFLGITLAGSVWRGATQDTGAADSASVGSKASAGLRSAEVLHPEPEEAPAQAQQTKANTPLSPPKPLAGTDSASYSSENRSTEAIEERVWAEEVHQTSAERLSEIARMDDSTLRQLAESGDPVAQKQFGTRLVRNRGNVQDGIEWLTEAASHGSPSAARELASIYLHGVDGIAADMLAFLAWSQVALFMGDWTALVGPGYQVQSELALRERILVDAFTAELLDDLNQRSLARSGDPLAIKPRPGYRRITDP